MNTLLISTAAVAIAEIGDKTQLLSLILAAKYRRILDTRVESWTPTTLAKSSNPGHPQFRNPNPGQPESWTPTIPNVPNRCSALI